MIYKLKYTSEEEAISDLLDKKVLIKSTDLDGNEVNSYPSYTKAVVYIGQIVDTSAVVEDMKIIIPATYIDGYHVDVMTDIEIKFDNEIFPNNPKHLFA
jgi:hypothetical protein